LEFWETRDKGKCDKWKLYIFKKILNIVLILFLTGVRNWINLLATIRQCMPSPIIQLKLSQ
jgi:hypothetical protein